MQGQLVALDLRDGSPLLPQLVHPGLRPLRTTFEGDFGVPLGDLYYVQPASRVNGSDEEQLGAQQIPTLQSRLCSCAHASGRQCVHDGAHAGVCSCKHGSGPAHVSITDALTTASDRRMAPPRHQDAGARSHASLDCRNMTLLCFPRNM